MGSRHIITAITPFLIAFGAQAQCDELQIVSVTYAPFTDTALQVTVLNEGMELFGYPIFSLIDMDNDTIAREQLNFFGLPGMYPSTHRMDLLPGMEMPASTFSGTLQLKYSSITGTQYCIFPIETELCPQEECNDLVISLFHQSASAVNSSFNWEITDQGNNIAASGTMEIDTDQQPEDQEEICLPQGSYTLVVQQVGNDGGTFLVQINQPAFASIGPMTSFAAGDASSLQFDHYPACSELSTHVSATPTTQPVISVLGNTLHVLSQQEDPLGDLLVLDMTGRTIARSAATSTSHSIDLSDHAAGIYVLHCSSGTWLPQRFWLP